MPVQCDVRSDDVVEFVTANPTVHPAVMTSGIQVRPLRLLGQIKGVWWSPETLAWFRLQEKALSPRLGTPRELAC